MLEAKTGGTYTAQCDKLLNQGMCTFIVEEVVTVAESMGLLPQVSQFVFIFFEILIISFFIYTLLLQKEYLQNRGL